MAAKGGRWRQRSLGAVSVRPSLPMVWVTAYLIPSVCKSPEIAETRFSPPLG